MSDRGNSAPLLVLVLAYDAERTIQRVLDRLPWPQLGQARVLVVDDASSDHTWEAISRYLCAHPEHNIGAHRMRDNQGYGGAQRWGYRYAVEHGFSAVVLLHGDAQYAPEVVSRLAAPVLRGEADAVLGSRMLVPFAALHGGMPMYKFLGNRVLTAVQNKLAGTTLSEFHTGYRCYSTEALRQLPLEMNSNEFHFDTQILLQLRAAGRRIHECPVATWYGDEVCHVSGVPYAAAVLKESLLFAAHQRRALRVARYTVATETD